MNEVDHVFDLEVFRLGGTSLARSWICDVWPGRDGMVDTLLSTCQCTRYAIPRGLRRRSMRSFRNAAVTAGVPRERIVASTLWR